MSCSRCSGISNSDRRRWKLTEQTMIRVELTLHNIHRAVYIHDVRATWRRWHNDKNPWSGQSLATEYTWRSSSWRWHLEADPLSPPHPRTILKDLKNNPIRNLSSWQSLECSKIADYGRSCLEMPMKQENLELVIVEYPRNFSYWKFNYKQRWSSSAFPSVPNMFVKVVGIPAIFDDSQFLADHHWLFHSYPMILSVYATTILFEFWKQRHTHTHTHTHTHAHTRTHTNAPWRQFTV